MKGKSLLLTVFFFVCFLSPRLRDGGPGRVEGHDGSLVLMGTVMSVVKCPAEMAARDH